MAALCAATAIIAVVVPFAGGLALLGTVPMGLVSYRYRLRVLIAATVAGCTIAFLIAGLGGLMTVVHSAYIGGLAGAIKRRQRGAATVVASAVVAGVLFGGALLALLALAARLRHLLYRAMSFNIDGVANALRHTPGQAVTADQLRDAFDAIVPYWPAVVMVWAVLNTVFVTLIGWWALSRVLTRLSGIPDVHKLDPTESDSPVAPVPVCLDDVRFRYPDTARDAMGPLSMRVDPGEHVAITGANGSGKTTLMLMLAGREPSAGAITRPGAVGLGKTGGTAVIMQHPESQVLGTRVADDVVWGLPADQVTDVDRLLAEVGLDGLADRDTGGLSGGELQRLAVAAALAREPALLIADEVTSMVDQQGREALISVLSGLTEHHRTSLVHITHYNDEAASADRVVRLSGTAENVRPAGPEMVHTAPVPLGGADAVPEGPVVLELRGVGHRYVSGSPWESTALRDISFAVHEGEGLLIHGLNGSGKSTLAWIMAGLTVPTSGSCLLDDAPVSDQVGAVAISFQAARLQLMRSNVGREVASSAGFSRRDRPRIIEALGMVGLDPALAERRIDQLSGGQMRRVVLAGLLARRPRALILDEPLAGLDADSQRALVALLAELRRTTGLTVVVISHDFAGLEELCPRTLHLHRGELVEATVTTGGRS